MYYISVMRAYGGYKSKDDKAVILNPDGCLKYPSSVVAAAITDQFLRYILVSVLLSQNIYLA